MSILAARTGHTRTIAHEADASGLTLRPGLVALVVTHNRLHQLRQTVQAILAEPVDKLVVVDNASKDGTSGFLADITDDRLVVLRQGENRGGAGGFEFGLAEVTRRFDPDWCVVMDDDARPEPNMLARFREETDDFRQGGWDAIAAGVFYPDGAICEMNRPSRNPFWHLSSFLRTALGGGRRGFHMQDSAYGSATVQKVDAASFVGLFLSRGAIRRGGLPDGQLFIYGDDVIYTLSLTRAGGEIGFAPWLRFEHDCSTFERGTLTGRNLHKPLWKVYYNYRNGLLGYALAAGPILFWPVLLVVVPKWLLKSRAYGADAPIFRRLLRLAVVDALKNRRDRPHAEVKDLAKRPG
jgi:rhamnopyranosyl-N-acetylglucosaminyl-diphospho-decaprenol beta-1,3/1,4-galactofuranosyltransferase